MTRVKSKARLPVSNLGVGLACVAAVMAAAPAEGAIYWNLFNIEGESALTAQYVTYASLTDMLNDTNRLGVFDPNSVGASGENVVGSGSDGSLYWSLFNIEGESALTAQYVTYASLTDMLNDTNRLGVFDPDGFGVGRNVVGSGAAISLANSVPEPSTWAMMLLGFGAAGFAVRRARKREPLLQVA